jgi:hypothetical protein
MDSKIAKAIALTNHPVALVWADTAPEGAVSFKPGRWGCVMALFAAAAAKARVGVFDRQTYGCWGGGTGLGFGRCYQTFPGGEDCFRGFLADGNERTEKGRKVGEMVASWRNRQMTDDFLQGERYVKDAAAAERWLGVFPFRDIPAKYVIVKPIEQVDPTCDDVKNVTFFVDPDRLSALVILANYATPERENVTIPWGAGCQSIGAFAYREMENEHPRAVVGLTDISARNTVRPVLGQNVMSLTAPWPVFLRMEESVEGSFLQRESWHRLRQGEV